MSGVQVPGRLLHLHGGVQCQWEGGGGEGEGALDEESQPALHCQVRSQSVSSAAHSRYYCQVGGGETPRLQVFSVWAGPAGAVRAEGAPGTLHTAH